MKTFTTMLILLIIGLFCVWAISGCGNKTKFYKYKVFYTQNNVVITDSLATRYISAENDTGMICFYTTLHLSATDVLELNVIAYPLEEVQ